MTKEERKTLEERCLSEVPVEKIFELSGQLCFMDGVPRLVACLSDATLIELVHGWGEKEKVAAGSHRMEGAQT